MVINNPAPNCDFCPRLKAFREANQQKYPSYHNAPVNAFGDLTSGGIAIIGLAPGLQGANQTGRPFTGDFAGDLLYATLKKFGYLKGEYRATPNDGIELIGCHIINAVRCVPPENKPTIFEINQCSPFLKTHLEMIKPNILIALGQIAHNAILKTLGLTLSHYKFGHGNQFDLENHIPIDSYHCSRYNTNTGVLTTEMFENIFQKLSNLTS